MNTLVDIPEAKRKALSKVLENPLAITRELNNRSLFHFLEWAWPELTSQPFVSNWHLPYLCEHLERVAEGVANRDEKQYDLLINISPGSTKTILISIVFPVWCWTKWYWMRFITASYSSELSLESATYSRDLIKSDLFKQVYPELSIKTDKDRKSNYRIVKEVRGVGVSGVKQNRVLTGGNRYSTSIGGTLTGFHADILIWDDALNPQQAASDAEMATANYWIDTTLPTRKTNKAVSVTIGIMQRLHENDPSGHLLAKKKKNLKHICIPGEIIHYGSLVRPRSLKKFYKNGLFDANRMSWSVLHELEMDLGQYGFAGQIGQNPVPPEGGMFKTAFFQFTNENLSDHIVKVVRYWDKAGSEGTGAYTVGVKMARLTRNRLFIMDVKRGQWSTHKREKIIRATADADGTEVHVVVEQEPGSGGKESAENTIRNLLGFVVKADKPTGNKEFRADPFSVQVNNGNVLIQIAEWNKAFVDELKLFPNSTYKDQVDASSGAFNYLVTKKKVKRLT